MDPLGFYWLAGNRFLRNSVMQEMGKVGWIEQNAVEHGAVMGAMTIPSLDISHLLSERGVSNDLSPRLGLDIASRFQHFT